MILEFRFGEEKYVKLDPTTPLPTPPERLEPEPMELSKFSLKAKKKPEQEAEKQ